MSSDASTTPPIDVEKANQDVREAISGTETDRFNAQCRCVVRLSAALTEIVELRERVGERIGPTYGSPMDLREWACYFNGTAMRKFITDQGYEVDRLIMDLKSAASAIDSALRDRPGVKE